MNDEKEVKYRQNWLANSNAYSLGSLSFTVPFTVLLEDQPRLRWCQWQFSCQSCDGSCSSVAIPQCLTKMKGCTSGYKRKTDFLHQYIQCELRGLDRFTSRGLIFGQDNRMLTSCQQVGEPTGIAERNKMNSCCNHLHFPAKLPLLHITFFSTIARVSWQVTQSTPWQQWISYPVQNQPSKHGYLDMCLAHNAKKKSTSSKATARKTPFYIFCSLQCAKQKPCAHTLAT